MTVYLLQIVVLLAVSIAAVIVTDVLDRHDRTR